MPTKVRTFAANEATRRIRANTSKEELRKLGLRLLGIYGAQCLHRKLRALGIKAGEAGRKAALEAKFRRRMLRLTEKKEDAATRS